MKVIEPLLATEGWKAIRTEMERLHDLALRSLIADVSTHSTMAKQAGRLDALRELLALPDKIIRDGKASARALNSKGGTSPESEDDGE
jgi:hypothetical protein